MRERRGRPMLLVDLAVPRAIEPAVNDFDGVYLYDIDDLEGVMVGDRGARAVEAVKCRGDRRHRGGRVLALARQSGRRAHHRRAAREGRAACAAPRWRASRVVGRPRAARARGALDRLTRLDGQQGAARPGDRAAATSGERTARASTSRLPAACSGSSGMRPRTRKSSRAPRGCCDSGHAGARCAGAVRPGRRRASPGATRSRVETVVIRTSGDRMTQRGPAPRRREGTVREGAGGGARGRPRSTARALDEGPPPRHLAPGLVLGSVPLRADARDVLDRGADRAASVGLRHRGAASGRERPSARPAARRPA